MVSALLRSLAATVEMALPTVCGGCGAPGPPWCVECGRGAAHAAFQGGPRQVGPTPRPVGYPPTWATCPYDAGARAALVAFKDGERRDLERVLAPMLAQAMATALAQDPRLRAVLASGNGPVFVVPVPSSPAAVRRRGDAPLEWLTRSAVARLAPSEHELIISRALRLRRRVVDQARLDRRQRAGNVDGAMEVRPRWRASLDGVSCLVVDDVLTTGATLAEAARALRAGGTCHVAAATVAATRKRASRGAVPDAAGVDNDDVWSRDRGQVAG